MRCPLRIMFPYLTTLQMPSTSFKQPSILNTLIGSSLKLALTWVLADIVTTLLLCWRLAIMGFAISILDFLCIISNNAKPSIIYMSIFCSKLHEVSPLSFCVHYLCVRLCRALFFSSLTRSFSLRSSWKYASEKSYLACP